MRSGPSRAPSVLRGRRPSLGLWPAPEQEWEALHRRPGGTACGSVTVLSEACGVSGGKKRVPAEPSPSPRLKGCRSQLRQEPGFRAKRPRDAH